MKAIGIILLLLVWQSGFSQWNDDFFDGDYTFNPSWNGDTADFIIENNILRLFAPDISSSSYLATGSEVIDDATWEFSVHLDFNPSSSNYTKVYLVSNNHDLTTSLNGYFVKVGNTTDEISLYRQDGQTETKIIDGLDGRVDLSLVEVDLQITRSKGGVWQLSSKLSTEPDWVIEGAITDSTHVSSSYFGLLCTYTSTRSKKFYFDNFIITGNPYVDIEPPRVDTVYSITDHKIIVKFNEPVTAASTTSVSNYLLNQQFSPIAANASDRLIELEFARELEVLNSLSIHDIEDNQTNIIIDTAVQVVYVNPEPAAFGDIIINEIMADPAPREDLPEVEYIELYNSTAKAINMTDWSFMDKISQGVMGRTILLPDSFIILTNQPDIEALRSFGNVMGLAPWPSLNNAGDSLSLVNEKGEVIDVLVYAKNWHTDDSKADGGWSLERINPHHPCSGYLNWATSNDPRGGTPGIVNSVIAIIDQEPPIISNYQIQENKVSLEFNEPLSESLGSIATNPANTVITSEVIYNLLSVTFNQPFLSGVNNELIFTSVADCFGNVADSLKIAFVPDFIPPAIDTVYANYPNILEIYFTEPIKSPPVTDFNLSPIVEIISIITDTSNPTHVSLQLAAGLMNEANYTLITDNIADIFGNTTNQVDYTFNYAPLRFPKFGEVLITEIMADPTPVVNLPEVEYLELTNKTLEPLLLKGLILADARDEVILPTSIIQPGERVLLTKTTAKTKLAAFATIIIGIPNWPTLNNSGDVITLLSPEHDVINSVSYNDDWYKNDEKSAGGWSLELIDENNYCQGDKVWTASNDVLGGTPGEENSIIESIYDLQPPHIIEAFAFTNDSILIRFNKPLAGQLPEFRLLGTIIKNSGFANYAMDECFLFVEPLQPQTIYKLVIDKIVGCNGNFDNNEEVSFFLPEVAEAGEIVISEVLFNPVTDGVDFIEVYNNSAKYISMYNWQLSNGVSVKEITSRDLISPNSYRVFTSSPNNIIDVYPKAIEENIYAQEIPVMPNDEGNIAIYTETQSRLDSIHYEAAWHFPYLENVDGVSLERINMNTNGTLSSNWASASSPNNFATPGYKNSQVSGLNGKAPIVIEPQVIVPDGDGRDDFATIYFNLDNPGMLVTVTVYNLNGQLIRELANNALVVANEGFIWDGTDIHGAVVPLGHYVIVATVILGDGSTRTLREKVVVAAGF